MEARPRGRNEAGCPAEFGWGADFQKVGFAAAICGDAVQVGNLSFLLDLENPYPFIRGTIDPRNLIASFPGLLRPNSTFDAESAGCPLITTLGENFAHVYPRRPEDNLVLQYRRGGIVTPSAQAMEVPLHGTF